MLNFKLFRNISRTRLTFVSTSSVSGWNSFSWVFIAGSQRQLLHLLRRGVIDLLWNKVKFQVFHHLKSRLPVTYVIYSHVSYCSIPWLLFLYQHPRYTSVASSPASLQSKRYLLQPEINSNLTNELLSSGNRLIKWSIPWDLLWIDRFTTDQCLFKVLTFCCTWEVKTKASPCKMLWFGLFNTKPVQRTLVMAATVS